ncbi:MAG TPA: amidophosphoribosyltransferase [Thermogutta sp.]|nr:amidophosphoribosyltransferase [Thermogutta sp.]
MNELHEECGVAAVYHLPGRPVSPLCPGGPMSAPRLIPRLLLDIQNRGQLAAGITRYCEGDSQLLLTYKNVGTVAEVFSLAQRTRFDDLMTKFSGSAALGHVRYATCGKDDPSYAQPFERHHIKKHKWFSFAFNGQLANYLELRERLLRDEDNHLIRDTDTEVIMHVLCRELNPNPAPDLAQVCRALPREFDGAYSLVFLNALGELVVLRDPLGFKPLSWAFDGSLFAAASESVALLNLGFPPEAIKPVKPGQAIIVSKEGIRFEQFGNAPHCAHCFFEWIYFSNVASTLDGRSVYLARKALGEELARLETLPVDDGRTIVVPVPDTSKAAADAMAFALGVPCLEGLIRNRYTGRTFIDSHMTREERANAKYTPLREVLEGKRVLLVEDSIVRSTTMRVLVHRMRALGRPAEIHIRVACPPIISPCFYGIDMSTMSELFAPRYITNGELTEAIQARMAKDLGADSLRYLPVEAVARAIGIDPKDLCQACITGSYPTPWGQKLAEAARARSLRGETGRTYDAIDTTSERCSRPSPGCDRGLSPAGIASTEGDGPDGYGDTSGNR